MSVYTKTDVAKTVCAFLIVALVWREAGPCTAIAIAWLYGIYSMHITGHRLAREDSKRALDEAMGDFNQKFADGLMKSSTIRDTIKKKAKVDD